MQEERRMKHKVYVIVEYDVYDDPYCPLVFTSPDAVKDYCVKEGYEIPLEPWEHGEDIRDYNGELIGRLHLRVINVI